MFIRFVIHSLDPDPGRRQGLFQVTRTLEQRGVLSQHDAQRLEDILEWLRKNLDAPSRLAISIAPQKCSGTQLVS